MGIFLSFSRETFPDSTVSVYTSYIVISGCTPQILRVFGLWFVGIRPKGKYDAAHLALIQRTGYCPDVSNMLIDPCRYRHEPLFHRILETLLSAFLAHTWYNPTSPRQSRYIH